MIGHSGKADVPARRQYGAGEQFGSVDAAGDVGGLETSLASLAEIAGLDLRFAEIAEQLRLERIVPGALERERFNRVVQMSRRLLVGELLFRGSRGLPRIFDGGIGIAWRGALTVMICDFGVGLARLIETADRFRNAVL
jgi:hypothetical protein